MSLQEKLSQLNGQTTAALPEKSIAVMREETQRLRESHLVESAPQTGDTLEDFDLPNHLGEMQGLAALRECGPVVVSFYCGGWCPYCNLELGAYQAVLPQIKAAGASLVAITPELPDASLSTSEKKELEFEILTDVNAEYTRKLGLVFTLPERFPLHRQRRCDNRLSGRRDSSRIRRQGRAIGSGERQATRPPL